MQGKSLIIKQMRFTLWIVVLFCVWNRAIGQGVNELRGSVWSGTHSPLKKGTELFFQGDTLVWVDLEGIKPADQYLYTVKSDTLILQSIDELSFTCRGEGKATYRISFANNGEKMLLKPIHDECMERFTLLVSESPWFRKRDDGSLRRDWYFLDPEKDKFAGASLNEAYKFARFRKSTPVAVAVIDCPVDYTHPDLKPNLWINPAELSGNQVDDDKNGWKDDIHGWFFACSRSGEAIRYDQRECTRTYTIWKARFDTVTNPKLLKKSELADFLAYRKAKAEFLKGYEPAIAFQLVFSDSVRFLQVVEDFRGKARDPLSSAQILALDLGIDAYGKAASTVFADLYQNQPVQYYANLLRSRFSWFRQKREQSWLYDYNPEWNPRKETGDHPENQAERMYGAGFLKTPQLQWHSHGTHVAGIIGAKRGNGFGTDGIADAAQLMTLGAVPASGDERDKDVANAIRYAADHGARIINMSFSKGYSPYRQVVEEALLYAEKKGLLLIRAAGNQHADLDTQQAFPSSFVNGRRLSNMLIVGNVTHKLDSELVASSSNYGAKTVDIFAPGSQIYSTVPGGLFQAKTGTSMAAPVVAGVAAFIWSYFPNLTAAEIRRVILESAYKPQVLVKKPGTGEKVPFQSLSVSGGIVNAKTAWFLAEKMARKKTMGR